MMKKDDRFNVSIPREIRMSATEIYIYAMGAEENAVGYSADYSLWAGIEFEFSTSYVAPRIS